MKNLRVIISSICLFLMLLIPVFILSAKKPAPLKLLEPTGSFAVATTQFEWVDPLRPETFTDDPNDYRDLMVYVWYPAEKTKAAKGKTVDLPLSKAQSAYPVLVFSHGFGCMPEYYTVQMKELASHGYVIFSIAHPYECAQIIYPDKRVVAMSPRVLASLQSDQQKEANWILEQYLTAATPEIKDKLLREFDALSANIVQNSLEIWIADTQFVMDQIERLQNGKIESGFTGCLDQKRLGVFGHSYGGSIAGKVYLVDKRCKAGLNMDGYQYGQYTDFSEAAIQQPFMVMYSDSIGSGINDFMFHRVDNWAYSLHIKGSKHLGFTDIPMLIPASKWDEEIYGSIDPFRMATIVNQYLLGFFDKYLQETDNSLLNAVNPEYPEVEFTVHRPGEE